MSKHDCYNCFQPLDEWDTEAQYFWVGDGPLCTECLDYYHRRELDEMDQRE